MSKMDGLRAMREARYARATSPATKPAVNTARSERPVPMSSESGPAAADSGEALEPALCGHRSINGRSCTREQGHASKNHRYS
jgi:hypothetical protein